jgi:hypothetical protein
VGATPRRQRVNTSRLSSTTPDTIGCQPDMATAGVGSLPAVAELETAMVAMESARTTFEDAAHRVSNAVQALEKGVLEANAAAQLPCAEASLAAHKRRRLSGGSSTESAPQPEEDSAGMRAFNDAAVDVEAQLQTTLRGMARVNGMTRDARGAVDVAKARAAPLLGAERLAAAREARNRSCSQLIRMLERADLGGGNAHVVFGHLYVLELWRARGVCKAFRRWAREALTRLPRPLAVGGTMERSDTEAMNLATLKWTAHPAIAVPPLPEPVDNHAIASSASGRLTLVGGVIGDELLLSKQALQWSPGSQRWESLPSMSMERMGAQAVTLTDGRTLVAGGLDGDDVALDLVEVLAADGGSWETMAPMPTARFDFAAAVLPSGHVLVAGGNGGGVAEDDTLTMVELWDPATNVWSVMPPLSHARSAAEGCILPSGRFALVGGDTTGTTGTADTGDTGEAFDPIRRVWEPLPCMNSSFRAPTAVPVAGGMLVLAGNEEEQHVRAPQLFDEESGRWFTLPYQPMLRKRSTIVLPGGH